MGITAKILKLINSAFFGLNVRVSSIHQAVSLLGLFIVKSLVLSTHLFSQFDQSRVPGLNLEESTRHSTATGALAKAVAKTSPCAIVLDDAFTAGLLHDVGKLILAANLPGDYAQAMQLAEWNSMPQWQAEQEVFGASHGEVGAYLLGLWSFPDRVVEAVAYHHRPRKCSHTEFTPLTAVHVADALEHHHECAAELTAVPGLDAEYIQTLRLSGCLEKWRKLCSEMVQQEEQT